MLSLKSTTALPHCWPRVCARVCVRWCVGASNTWHLQCGGVGESGEGGAGLERYFLIPRDHMALPSIAKNGGARRCDWSDEVFQFFSYVPDLCTPNPPTGACFSCFPRQSHDFVSDDLPTLSQPTIPLVFRLVRQWDGFTDPVWRARDR